MRLKILEKQLPMPTGPPRKGHQPATSEVQASVHCPQSFDTEEFSVIVFLFRLRTAISTKLHLVRQKRTACLSSSGKRSTKGYGKWIFPTRKNCCSRWRQQTKSTWSGSVHRHMDAFLQPTRSSMARTWAQGQPWQECCNSLRGRIRITQIMHGLFYTIFL